MVRPARWRACLGSNCNGLGSIEATTPMLSGDAWVSSPSRHREGRCVAAEVRTARFVGGETGGFLPGVPGDGLFRLGVDLE